MNTVHGRTKILRLKLNIYYKIYNEPKLSLSGIVVNFLSSVFETFRELAVFVEVHNFGYLKKNDISNFNNFRLLKIGSV